MRDPKRIIKVLKVVERKWRAMPQLRLGQLILNYIPEDELYFIEDSDLLKVLEGAKLREHSKISPPKSKV